MTETAYAVIRASRGAPALAWYFLIFCAAMFALSQTSQHKSFSVATRRIAAGRNSTLAYK
jgi:hypothetical protein